MAADRSKRGAPAPGTSRGRVWSVPSSEPIRVPVAVVVEAWDQEESKDCRIDFGGDVGFSLHIEPAHLAFWTREVGKMPQSAAEALVLEWYSDLSQPGSQPSVEIRKALTAALKRSLLRRRKGRPRAPVAVDDAKLRDAAADWTPFARAMRHDIVRLEPVSRTGTAPGVDLDAILQRLQRAMVKQAMTDLKYAGWPEVLDMPSGRTWATETPRVDILRKVYGDRLERLVDTSPMPRVVDIANALAAAALNVPVERVRRARLHKRV